MQYIHRPLGCVWIKDLGERKKNEKVRRCNVFSHQIFNPNTALSHKGKKTRHWHILSGGNPPNPTTTKSGLTENYCMLLSFSKNRAMWIPVCCGGLHMSVWLMRVSELLPRAWCTFFRFKSLFVLYSLYGWILVHCKAFCIILSSSYYAGIFTSCRCTRFSLNIFNESGNPTLILWSPYPNLCQNAKIENFYCYEKS